MAHALLVGKNYATTKLYLFQFMLGFSLTSLTVSAECSEYDRGQKGKIKGNGVIRCGLFASVLSSVIFNLEEIIFIYV